MQIQKDRRALHKIPELVRQLPLTNAYITQSLRPLSCRSIPVLEYGICAFFDFGAPSAIAFRADMDALPITEQTGLPFVSCHPGKMHACGHDGHMAILLELARRLDKKTSLPHNVLLVFQPAEETVGGANDICKSGIFEELNVKAIFGLHLWPGLETGKVFSRPGAMMSRVSEVTVEVFGLSAHLANASMGVDALAACTEYYLWAANLERSLPPEVSRVLGFGKMEAGTVRNAVPAYARLEGSIRAFDDDTFDYLRDGLLEIGYTVGEESGCHVDVRFTQGYPAIINPPALYEKVCAAVPVELLDAPTMISEDFSCYQKHLPGMFFFLGLGDVPALHADTFNFDETVLLKGADFFETLAERFV